MVIILLLVIYIGTSLPYFTFGSSRGVLGEGKINLFGLYPAN